MAAPKSRGQLPHLPYPKMNVTRTINAHRAAAGGAFDPDADVSSASLTIWLEPDSYNDTTHVWADKTANGNDFTASSGYEASVVSGGAEYNSENVVRFNDSYLTGPDISSLTEGEMFVLFDLDEDPPSVNVDAGGWKFGTQTGSSAYNHFTFTNGNIYEDFGNSIRRNLGNPTADFTSPRIVNMWSASADWACNIDGSSHYTTGSNTPSFPTEARLGAPGLAVSRFHQGRFRALLLYDAKLSTADRSAVYDYLDAMR